MAQNSDSVPSAPTKELKLLEVGTNIETLYKNEVNLASRVEGKADSLRNAILSMVADNRWVGATRELRIYQAYKTEQPGYDQSTKVYFDQCVDLIENIQKLMVTPSLKMLPFVKRQRIYDEVTRNFDRLKMLLSKLEQAENDIKVRDTRATNWFLRTFMVCVWMVFLAGATSEGMDMDRPLEVICQDAAEIFFRILGL